MFDFELNLSFFIEITSLQSCCYVNNYISIMQATHLRYLLIRKKVRRANTETNIACFDGSSLNCVLLVLRLDKFISRIKSIIWRITSFIYGEILEVFRSDLM